MANSIEGDMMAARGQAPSLVESVRCGSTMATRTKVSDGQVASQARLAGYDPDIVQQRASRSSSAIGDNRVWHNNGMQWTGFAGR